jgi:hypothetical protein
MDGTGCYQIIHCHGVERLQGELGFFDYDSSVTHQANITGGIMARQRFEISWRNTVGRGEETSTGRTKIHLRMLKGVIVDGYPVHELARHDAVLVIGSYQIAPLTSSSTPVNIFSHAILYGP